MAEPVPVCLVPPRAIDELDLLEKSSDHSGNVGATTTEMLPANFHRTAVFIVNDSDATVYLALGISAVMHLGIRLNAAGGAFEINKINLWRGSIHAISAAGTKNLTIIEVESRYAYI